MMLLRAQVLAHGPLRRARRGLLRAAAASMLNRGVHPVIPAQGSVGASGDLAPLAHLALGADRAKARREYRRRDAAGGRSAAVARRSQPLVLEAKEGLALVNGTQYMTAVGGLALARRRATLHASPTSPARCRSKRSRARARAFDERILGARPHPGQIARRRATCARSSTAAAIAESHSGLRQGPGPLLAALHAAGARRDARRARLRARGPRARDRTASTDNPLVFADGRDGRSISRRQLPRPAGRRSRSTSPRSRVAELAQHLASGASSSSSTRTSRAACRRSSRPRAASTPAS